MKICNLASGSKGNCTCITYNKTSILIDQGLSLRELTKRATERSIDLQSLSAIVITHEHIDHVKGVEKLSKHYQIPIYVHQASLGKLKWDIPTVMDVDMDKPFEIGDIKVEPFRLPHDSEHNLGFRVDNGSKSVALATDFGVISDNILAKLSSSDLTIIESNHDIQMLMSNPKYSRQLKQRIMSNNGHLSNEKCGIAISKLVENGVSRVMLAHLSEENNTPELAFDSVRNCLNTHKIKEGRDVALDIASQTTPSRWIEI